MLDVVIVGAGLFGATCARELVDSGLSVLVIEKENEPGGMCRDEWQENILVHAHGPHIFHTNNLAIWQYVQKFVPFRNYSQFDIAYARGGLYSFPINLLTLYQVFGIDNLKSAEAYFRCLPQSANEYSLEDCAINHFGEVLYNLFIRDYTIKQWGRQPSTLPASIIKRVPVRLTFDARYHDTQYQGLPETGYTALVQALLQGVDCIYGVNYNQHRGYIRPQGRTVIYSGSPDELYDYDLGRLEYRTLDFETKVFDGSYQGTSVIRHTDDSVPYTRVIEHKYFDALENSKTVVSWETPREWQDESDQRYYPIPDDKNAALASQYMERARQNGYFIGGRLGSYRYMNMDQVIGQALNTVKKVKECLHFMNI